MMITDSGLLFWATLYMLLACQMSLVIFSSKSSDWRTEFIRGDSMLPCILCRIL